MTTSGWPSLPTKGVKRALSQADEEDTIDNLATGEKQIHFQDNYF